MKLDEYFSVVDDTPAHCASIVTVPHLKWKYIQHAWANIELWTDVIDPHSWLPMGKKASMESFWMEYKALPVPDSLSQVGQKRSRAATHVEWSKVTGMVQL